MAVSMMVHFRSKLETLKVGLTADTLAAFLSVTDHTSHELLLELSYFGALPDNCFLPLLQRCPIKL
jgi:hypothetical protein